jgi:hypothetical protein
MAFPSFLRKLREKFSQTHRRSFRATFFVMVVFLCIFVSPIIHQSFPGTTSPEVTIRLAASTLQNNSLSTIAPSAPATTSDIWYKVVALPLFNDSMLGASSITSYDPVIPGLGSVYNFVLIVAIIMMMVGAALALIMRRAGKGGSDSMIMDVIIGLIAVIAFPSIYDGVARMINYLTQSLIAYPNPYYDYGSTLQVLWNNMEFAHGWSLWTLLTNSFLQIAFFIISGIIYIMLFFLGVARIFLIGAVIVAFPLSMGLRLIPFTRKLCSMIDDTLFGLMLASVMSSIVLGVGSYILSPGVWNSSSGNIFFQAVGSNGENWVAAASLLTAILMPTVLAPLTATIFQTASQVAMTGAGVASLITIGGITGGVGGLSAASSAVGTLGKTAAISGLPPPSIAQKLVAGMRAFGTAGLPAIGYNMASLGSSGFVDAVGGGGAAASVIKSAMPLKTPQAMSARAQSLQARNIAEAHSAAGIAAIGGMREMSLGKGSSEGVNPTAVTAATSKIKFSDKASVDLVDRNDGLRLATFKAGLPNYQSLSDSLVDSKIITAEASKEPRVQSEIRKLYVDFVKLDPKNPIDRQKLANLHNYFEISRKLGRPPKEKEDSDDSGA